MIVSRAVAPVTGESLLLTLPLLGPFPSVSSAGGTLAAAAAALASLGRRRSFVNLRLARTLTRLSDRITNKESERARTRRMHPGSAEAARDTRAHADTHGAVARYSSALYSSTRHARIVS